MIKLCQIEIEIADYIFKEILHGFARVTLVISIYTFNALRERERERVLLNRIVFTITHHQ